MALLSKLPLRVTVPLLLALPVVVIALVLSLLGYLHGRASANELASDMLEQVHGRIDDRLATLLDLPHRLGRINRSLIADGRLDTADLRSWRRELHEQTSAFPELSGVEIGFADGRCVWVFRYPGTEGYELGVKDERTGDQIHEYPLTDGGEIAGERVGAYVYDPRVRPWYTAGAEAGAPTFGRPYGWVNKDGSVVTLGLPYSTPVHRDGDLLGVIGVEVSLADLSRFLESLAIAQTGMAMIVDAEQVLVANSVGAAVADDEVNPILAADSEDERIRAVSASVAERFGSWSAIEDRAESRIDVGDVPHLLMISPVAHDGSLQWFIATLVPEDDFLAGVKAGRNRSIAVATGVVVITVALGAVLALFLVRPMLRVVDYARTVGAGDLDARIDLRMSPELAQLSDELNAMTEGLQDRMRLRHSLALAMEVQQSLLPNDTPEIPGLDLAGHSAYCDETGGDYYDFLEVTGVSDGVASVVVGDVMGHGIAAALLMATARGILHSRCQLPGSLADLLEHLNELLIQVTQGERFMTMLLATVDGPNKRLRWASAGHGYPFVYDPRTREFTTLDTGGLPLGVLEGADYEEQTLEELTPGCILLVPTDGVWEARNPEGEMFGLERLLECVRRNETKTAAELVRAIRDDVRTFLGEGEQDDDVTMVVVKVL